MRLLVAAVALLVVAAAHAQAPPPVPAVPAPAPAVAPAPTPAPPSTVSPPVVVVPTPAAPTVPFSGRVLKRGDRTPLPRVAVVVDQGELQTETDAEGRFRFEAIPLGKHRIALRSPTILPANVDEEMKAGKRLEVTYFVNVKERYSTVVRGQPIVRQTIEHVIPAEELKRIPGTQGDTLKAVQNMTGVARAPFGLGQLIVWGSRPRDTRVYVDGVFIPALYHFGGLRSTVNGEMVEQLTFLPGGFGTEYGRGMGGVVEVQSRRPRTDGYHGFVQLDLLDGSLSVEGPITKNLSFAVAGRRSWIDVFLPIFTTNDFQLSPVYWDYQGKLYWKASARDDVELFLFGSDDAVSLLAKGADPQFSASLSTHTYFHRALVRWQHRFKNRATLSLTASVGYDTPTQLKAQFGNIPISIEANGIDYSLRAISRIPLFPFLRLDAGLDFEGYSWTVTTDVPNLYGFTSGGSGASLRDEVTIFLHGIAPHATAQFSFFDKKLTLSPGLRLDMYSFTGYRGRPSEFNQFHVLLEPRLSLRYQITRWMAAKLAMGTYHQNPDPSHFIRLAGSAEIQPEVATHYVGGFEFQPTPTLTIQASAFYKHLSGLIVPGEKAGSPALVNDGQGRVYGGELLVRQELWKGLFGWVAYTVSRSDRKEHLGTPWHRFQYDQTHILTLIASYKLPRGFQVGLRFRFVSGNLYTPVKTSYADLNFGYQVPVYGQAYSQRLDPFHQLDVRLDKTWTYNRWRLSLYVDIQNVYNAKNPEVMAYNYDYSQSQPVVGLSFYPSIGLRGEF